MEISTRLFQLSREVEFPAIQMAANRLRLIEEGDFHFVERFQLKRIICEPKADNAPPNRLLQRIGFPLISTRVGRSSELSRVCKLNRYDIVREIAEDYLSLRGRTS